MKRITTTTAFVCLCTLLFAQNLQLRGRVVSGQESVEFANVILQTKDSAFISGGVTDQRGRFSMGNLSKGNYLLHHLFSLWLFNIIYQLFINLQSRKGQLIQTGERRISGAKIIHM